jgi:hypothetical protein
MADPIIPLEDFVGLISETSKFVTNEDASKQLSNKDFFNLIRATFGIQEGGKVGSGRTSTSAPGLEFDDFEKVIELIPKELRTPWTAQTVNWNQFLNTAENSGIKVSDNVKKYVVPAYEKYQQKLIEIEVEALGKAASADRLIIEQNNTLYNQIWGQEPLNLNISGITNYSNDNNSETYVGQYFQSVTDKIYAAAQSGEVPLTPTVDTESSLPPVTTTTPGSPGYVDTLGQTAVPPMTGNGVTVLAPNNEGSVSQTQTGVDPELARQQYLFENPERNYYTLMLDSAYKLQPVAGAGQFASQYGYKPTTVDEKWDPVKLYNFPRTLTKYSDIKELQDDLRKAGFFNYGDGQLPIAGVIDPLTRNAWQYFLSSAALAGQEPLQFLNSRIKSVGQLQWDQQVIGSDPLTIESQANQLGSSILGRGLNPEEIQQLQDVVRGWEKKTVTQGNFADEQMQFDMNANIEKYLQDTYQEEYVWTNYANSRAATARYWS